MFAWFLLLLAISLEVSASAALSRTNSFHDPFWTVLVVTGYGLSIWLLAQVVKQLPISIAYAVWAGVGTAGIAVVGVVFLGEGLDPVKIAALAFIVLGVVMLNLVGTSH